MAWRYSFLLCLLSFASVIQSAPVNFDNGAQGSTLSPFWVSFLSGLGAATVLILLILVVIGCVCCQDHGFKTFPEQNGIQLPQHRNSSGGNFDNRQHADSEFTIFPPDAAKLSYGIGNGDSEPVTFEPLPDIRPRNASPFERLVSSNHPPRPAYFKASVTRGLSLHDWFNPLHGGNFPRCRLQYLQEVGVGWYGQAVEGEAQQIVPDQRKTRVVVKILREDASPSEHMYFLHEVRLFRDLRHPNILRLLGQCLETDPFLVILEHCQSDLKTYLISQRSCSEDLVQGGGLLEMAYQLTLGLQFMHSKGFLHTDLAARNCLWDHQKQVKIGDYGTSYTLFPEDYYCVGEMAISLRWSAPETLHSVDKSVETKDVTQEANLWSFGVLLWELMELGKQPYMELSDDLVLAQVISQQQTKLEEPKTPCLHRALLYQVMQECWGPPETRPSIGKVQALLSHLQQNKEMPPSLAFEERWHTLQQQPLRQHNLPFSLALPETPPLVFESHFNPKSASLQNLRGSLEDIVQRQEQEKEEEKVQQEITLAIQELDDYLASEITSSEISGSGTPEQNELQRRKDSESDGDSAILCSSLAPADAQSDMGRETGDFTSLEDSPKSVDDGCRLPKYVSSCAAVNSPPSPPPSPSMRCGDFGCSPTNSEALPVAVFGPAHTLTLLDTPPVTPDALCSVSTASCNSRCRPIPCTDSSGSDSYQPEPAVLNVTRDWNVAGVEQSINVQSTQNCIHWDFGGNTASQRSNEDVTQKQCDVFVGKEFDADDELSVESEFSFLQNEAVGDMNDFIENMCGKEDCITSEEKPVGDFYDYDTQFKNVFQKGSPDYSIVTHQGELKKADGIILEPFSNICEKSLDSIVNITKDTKEPIVCVYKIDNSADILINSDLCSDSKSLILTKSDHETNHSVMNVEFEQVNSISENAVHLDSQVNQSNTSAHTMNTKSLTMLDTMAEKMRDNLLASCIMELCSSECKPVHYFRSDPVGNTILADIPNDNLYLSSNQKESACIQLSEIPLFNEIKPSDNPEDIQVISQCVTSNLHDLKRDPNLEKDSDDKPTVNSNILSAAAQPLLEWASENTFLALDDKNENIESLCDKAAQPIITVSGESFEEPEYTSQGQYEIDDILAGLEHDEIVLEKDYSPSSDGSGRKSAEDCTLFLEDLETGNREPIRCCASPQELLDDELLIVDVETNEAMMLNPVLRPYHDQPLYSDFLQVDSYHSSRLESILEESDETSHTYNDDMTQASSQFQPSPGNIVHSVPPELVFEGEEYLAGDYNDTDDDDESSFHSEDDDDGEEDVEASEEFHFQVVSPFAFTDNRPEDAYTPDFESETDDTSSSTGTSRSSSSGSFECRKDAPQSPVRIFSTTWDSKLSPVKSAIKSPEKSKEPEIEEEAGPSTVCGEMKKSVSFHEDNPMIVFSYPPAESDEESEGHEEIVTDEFAWNTDYKNYADWEFQWLEEDVPEEEVVTEEDSSDGCPPAYSVAKRGSFQTVDLSTMMYSLCCEDMLDSLESQTSLPSLSDTQDMVLTPLSSRRQLLYEVSNLSDQLNRPEIPSHCFDAFEPLHDTASAQLSIEYPQLDNIADKKNPVESKEENDFESRETEPTLQEVVNEETKERGAVPDVISSPVDISENLPVTNLEPESSPKKLDENQSGENISPDPLSNSEESQCSPTNRAILPANYKLQEELKVETVPSKEPVCAATSQLDQTSTLLENDGGPLPTPPNNSFGKALSFEIQPVDNNQDGLNSTAHLDRNYPEDTDTILSELLFALEEPYSLNISPDEKYVLSRLHPGVRAKDSLIVKDPGCKELASNLWAADVDAPLMDTATNMESKIVETTAVPQPPDSSLRTQPNQIFLDYPEDSVEAVNPTFLVAGAPWGT